MKRPHSKTLWNLAFILLLFCLLDVLLTTIGILYLGGEEGNPLIVLLAELLPGASPNIRIVHTVWLSKMSVMALVLLIVRTVIKTKPERDDKIMFFGLSCSLAVYVVVIAGWVWYYCRVLPL